MLTVFMVVLMLAGIFFSVANFTASDLDAAYNGSLQPFQDGAWSPFIGGISYCWFHPDYNDCVVGDTMWGPDDF